MRAIYYDTETTGISPTKDYIIEIAAYDPEKGLTFEEFAKPPISIPPEASSIHGITDKDVENAPTFEEIGKRFIDFCSGEVILIAHNNDSFDLPFLREEFKRHNLQMPLWKFLDSLKWARRYRSDLPRHALQFLREVYDFPSNNAHRALDDVMMLHQIFNCMIDDLSIKQVYTLLNLPKKLRHMPFGKHQGKPLSTIPKDYVAWLSKSGALEKEDNLELKGAFIDLGLLSATV